MSATHCAPSTAFPGSDKELSAAAAAVGIGFDFGSVYKIDTWAYVHWWGLWICYLLEGVERFSQKDLFGAKFIAL